MPQKIHPLIMDDELLSDFKEHIQTKYGSLRSFFGYSIEVAMFKLLADDGVKDYKDKWVLIHGVGVPSTGEPAHTHKIGNADKVLVQVIYDNLEAGQEISFKVLCTWMRRDCGLKDPRTHRSHVDTLVDVGVLRSLSFDLDSGRDLYVYYEVMERPDVLSSSHMDEDGAEVVEW